jgi:hypothetical protein
MAYAQQVAIDYRLNLPSLVNRNDILAILRQKSEQKPILKGWRNQLIGKNLLLLKESKVSINIEQNKIMLIQNLSL